MNADLEAARGIVKKHIAKGWFKMRYEEMVLDSDPISGKSMGELLDVGIPADRAHEAAFYAALRLRRTYRETNAAWAARVTCESEIERILTLVRAELVGTVMSRTKPKLLPTIKNVPKSSPPTALSIGFRFDFVIRFLKHRASICLRILKDCLPSAWILQQAM